MDGYTREWLKAIRESKTDKQLEVVINKIYTEGFQDGAEEGKLEED